MPERIILHIDMDAFFAAIEEKNNPHFRGKPIVVGADPKGGVGRGVVSTANYEARKYGIRSAMPISRAWRLCSDAVFLPVDFELYGSVSERISQILREITDNVGEVPVQQRSIDEFYCDISVVGSWEKAKGLAEKIKKTIFDCEQLTCSIGIGQNKLVAKIASDFKKPNGLTVVSPGEVTAFLDPMDISVIPGIGPKTAAALREKGIRLIKDLRNMPRHMLVDWFGRWGDQMWESANGKDDDPVFEDEAMKSVGEQETFEEDTLDQVFLVDRLRMLCESVWRTASKEKELEFRTITLTVRFVGFLTKTRSKTPKAAMRNSKDFFHTILQLFLPFLDSRENPGKKKIRLLGVRLSVKH